MEERLSGKGEPGRLSSPGRGSGKEGDPGRLSGVREGRVREEERSGEAVRVWERGAVRGPRRGSGKEGRSTEAVRVQEGAAVRGVGGRPSNLKRLSRNGLSPHGC